MDMLVRLHSLPLPNPPMVPKVISRMSKASAPLVTKQRRCKSRSVHVSHVSAAQATGSNRPKALQEAGCGRQHRNSRAVSCCCELLGAPVKLEIAGRWLCYCISCCWLLCASRAGLPSAAFREAAWLFYLHHWQYASIFALLPCLVPRQTVHALDKTAVLAAQLDVWSHSQLLASHTGEGM
jgi:hypothetical protein